MMRILFAMLALLLVSASPPPRDWRAATGVTAGGAFTVGNPAAKVKLVEYLSLTCPHCRDFAAQSKPVLHDTMVRRGLVAVETRGVARDPFDLAAWLVVRCAGPRRFQPLSSAIFATQNDWLGRGGSYVEANRAAIEAMPRLAQLKTIADQSGLSSLGLAAGLTRAALDRCLADTAAGEAIGRATETAFAEITGTPAFKINGAAVDSHDWPSLETRLHAAGVP